MTLGLCVCVCVSDILHVTMTLNRVMQNSWAISTPYYCPSPHYSIHFLLLHSNSSVKLICLCILFNCLNASELQNRTKHENVLDQHLYFPNSSHIFGSTQFDLAWQPSAAQICISITTGLPIGRCVLTNDALKHHLK